MPITKQARSLRRTQRRITNWYDDFVATYFVTDAKVRTKGAKFYVDVVTDHKDERKRLAWRLYDTRDIPDQIVGFFKEAILRMAGGQ